MFENLFNKIASIIITGALALASLFGYTPSQEFGAVNPVAGTVYYLSGSGIGASATSITLTSLTVPQSGYELVDSDFSTTFYLTIEPGNRTRQEIVSCTTVAQNADNTATLSGCSRGLLPFSPYTASSTYQFSHSGGTSVIFSNPPQLYEEFPARGDAESITGLWTFSSTSIPRLDSYLAATNDAQFISKKYADDLTASGVADGNYTTFGGYILATTSQVIAGTATSTATRYLVLPSELANTTSSAKNIIPITKTNGKLSQGFLDLTEGFTFSNNITATSGDITIRTSTTTSITTDAFNLLPAGVIQLYTSSTAPTGWLLTNGASYATSSYPRLFTVLGYTYGGSGANFNVPNLTGRTIFMASSTDLRFDTLGKISGEATTTLITANLPSHDHTIQESKAGSTGGDYGGFTDASLAGGETGTLTTGLTGNGTGFSNLPPYIVLNYIIKF